jgi:hypothetical protein
VIAALLAACGFVGARKSTTKADFIAQADAICSSYEDLVAKATESFKHPSPRQALARVQNRLVPLYQQRDNALAQLAPPAADRATVAQFIADVKAATNAMALDPAAYVAAHGATPQARKAAADAAAYGFAVCARL